MTNNETVALKNHEAKKTEHTEWIEKILHLRAYLEQEQEATKAIYQRYQDAQNELSHMIEMGNQLCLDLKAEYLERIEALNQQIRQLRYDVSRETQRYRHQLS